MKNISIIFFLFFFIFSCGKNDIDLSQVNNLNGNRIVPFGHAGMGISSQFPINSFESISNALNLGAEGVEVDIQMTKDSVIVLYHDRTLEEQTNLKGLIFENNWEYIKQGIYKNPIFAEYKIVSLDQLFEHLKNVKGYTFLLDFKLYQSDHSDEYVSTFINALVKIIDRHQMEDHVLSASYRTEYLKKLKELRPNSKLMVNTAFEQGLVLVEEIDAYGMVFQNDMITKEQIKQVHDKGIYVSLFGLHSKNDNLDAIEKHPDFIFSDKVKHLIKVLE